MAPLLVAMHGRYWIDGLASVRLLHDVAQVLVLVVPLLGGVVLLGLASRDWNGANAEPGPA